MMYFMGLFYSVYPVNDMYVLAYACFAHAQQTNKSRINMKFCQRMLIICDKTMKLSIISGVLGMNNDEFNTRR